MNSSLGLKSCNLTRKLDFNNRVRITQTWIVHRLMTAQCEVPQHFSFNFFSVLRSKLQMFGPCPNEHAYYKFNEAQDMRQSQDQMSASEHIVDVIPNQIRVNFEMFNGCEYN